MTKLNQEKAYDSSLNNSVGQPVLCLEWFWDLVMFINLLWPTWNLLSQPLALCFPHPFADSVFVNSPARCNSHVASKSRRAVGSWPFRGTCRVVENWGDPPSTFSPKTGPGDALPCCILPTRALFSLLRALFLHFCGSCWRILNGPQAWYCGAVLCLKSYKVGGVLGENTSEMSFVQAWPQY